MTPSCVQVSWIQISSLQLQICLSSTTPSSPPLLLHLSFTILPSTFSQCFSPMGCCLFFSPHVFPPLSSSFLPPSPSLCDKIQFILVSECSCLSAPITDSLIINNSSRKSSMTSGCSWNRRIIFNFKNQNMLDFFFLRLCVVNLKMNL